MGATDVDDTLELVRRARDDDRAARDELFERYLPRVRAIVAAKMKRKPSQLAESEDVLQEALLGALRGLAGFEPRSPGSFFDWISTIVANRIRDSWESGRADKRGGGRVRSFVDFRTSERGALERPDPGPSASAVARAHELSRLVDDALFQLAQRDQEAIVLRCLCGMGYAEIAERLSLRDDGAARVVVSRALARLAALLP